jgi:hypothetical protein
MMTSSPCLQFTGVATVVAVSCSDRRADDPSNRPVGYTKIDLLSPDDERRCGPCSAGSPDTSAGSIPY